MAEILELSDCKFKITMMNMLRILTGKVDNMQEQMGTIIKEMETLRNNQMLKMLKIKNTLTEMKDTLDGLISRLDTVKERISELENPSIETSPTEIQNEKKKKTHREKKQNRMSKNSGTITKEVLLHTQ